MPSRTVNCRARDARRSTGACLAITRAAAALPAEDRRAMAPAEIMGSIYRGLLGRIELDKFRVFEKEYRLSKPEKAGRITAQLFKSFLNWPR